MKSIIVYADESGTRDETGKEKRSEYPMIAGFAAPAAAELDALLSAILDRAFKGEL